MSIASDRRKTKRPFLFIILCSTILAMAFINGCNINPYNCKNVPEEYQDLEESTYYIYVLWRTADESISSFQETIFEDIVPEINSRVQKLSVMIADPDIKSPSLIKRPREDGSLASAIISVMVENQEAAKELTAVIEPHVHFIAGYKAAQAIPRDYEKNWEDGEASPGIKQVTLLQKRKDLAYEDFRDYWFCSHTPLALDINPIWRYERNEVVEAITSDAPPYNGIVGLHFQFVEDLTDLNRFFGGHFLANSIRIGIDVVNFIDMKSIEVIAMREYIIK